MELEQQNHELESASQMAAGAPVSVSNDPVVSKKFVELNAKQRQLTAANEVLKAKNQTQQKLITQCQAEIEQLHRQLERLTGRAPDAKEALSEEETRLRQQLSRLEQDNKGLLERFGELNMKMNVLQNDNLKLRRFVQRETGVEWDRVAQDSEWRGRNERIELMKVSQDKLLARNKELERQVAELSTIQGQGISFDDLSKMKEQEIRQRYLEQLNSYEHIIDEKKD